jgi:TRAP-type mannitol/chloroaromatic compound transport system substrate-binding protein
LRAFPSDLIGAARAQSVDVLGELTGRDAISRKIHASYLDFRGKAGAWSHISIEQVLAARG